jgi:Xaa-Pro aminopeptidase
MPVPDPFLYGERDGRPFAVIGAFDAGNVVAARSDVEVLSPEELGVDELLAAGQDFEEALVEVAVRAAQRQGVQRALVPHDFPLLLADRLRASGVELEPARQHFDDRRRAKSPAELDGIRRAQRAAEAGMGAAAAMITDGGAVAVDAVKDAISAAFAAHGAVATDGFIVAPGPQGALGHEMGHGVIEPGAPVVVDLWPQDVASGCFADMTRTFIAGGGDPPEDIVRWHGLARDALARVLDAIAPGVGSRDLWEVACDVFEAAGEPTQRTKAAGEVLRDGFNHALGHGIGLEVHEAPYLGRGPSTPLVAGDVVAVEPGCYRAGFGGVRLEDLVLVTDDGAEVLTDFPYDL